MAYLRPPLFVRRVFNPIAMRFRLADSHTLAVPRRASGKEQTVPVIPVEHGGATYLVSTRGESDWVRNVRAAGGGELRGRRGSQRFRIAEVPVDERPPIIEAYREKAGKLVGTYWEKLPDPADHPVFRVDGVQPEAGP